MYTNKTNKLINMKQYTITVNDYSINVFTDTQGVLNIKQLLEELGYKPIITN